MYVRLLGHVEAVDADTAEPIAIGGPTQRRVFAALALRHDEVVTVNQLVDVVWRTGDTPNRAEHNIRTYVHRLRSALGDDGDRIATVGAGYRLALGDGELDVADFDRLIGVAGRLVATGDGVAALDALEEAERLWRGDPLGEFEHEEWAVPDAARLRELHAELRTMRAALLLDGGRATEVIASLEALVRDEPYRERPRALLMRALYESGRQAEALRAFQEFRTRLIDEVGVEPTEELVALDRAIASGKPSTATAPSVRIGSYELHERIGEGAFAVVHRATQTSLGREVAVKIVRAELANQPEFIRRFEAEAQMVARIEQPGVVPLYDFWREPDRALLVMRWMTGGSLETRLDDGPWDVSAAVELVDQVASALDAAHRLGIVHRDVKPANILFDEAGRAFLGDFGIALGADERSRPEAALSEGSPLFASPEQLRREPAGPEADVHALAIVAFTLLTGRTPFADAPDEPSMLERQLHDPIPQVTSLRPELPPGVDEVLAIGAAKDPRNRYPTATGFAAALRAAAIGRERDVQPASVRPRANPYKGLRAFDETDAADFHGRERLVDELLGRLREPDTRMLALVGPSGSGKSSVVRAGLLPALRQGRLPGSASWFTTTMIPGAHPFEALEAALLRVAVNPPAALLEQLRDGERGLLRSIRRVVPDEDAVLTLVIDQFEEVFADTVDEHERDLFLRALTVAASEPGSPVRLVLTLRADFYDRPLRRRPFANLLKRHTAAITPMAPDELEHAIVDPAAAVGVGFEPGLVAEIVADVNREPGALPMLQYALTRAFDATDGDTITIDAYRSVGGLAGALAGRADDLWKTADAGERAATRRVFGRLVTLGEGTEDTRRRARRSELGTDPATDRTIDRFGAARLLTFDHEPATREPIVEIAHEALLREWPRLRTWLDEDREGLRVHRHLTERTAAWFASDRDAGDLYRGARLETAVAWNEDHPDGLNAAERSFLNASIAERDAVLAAAQERFDDQVRANRRLRSLVAVATAIAVLAGGIGIYALQQRSRADAQAADALAQTEEAVQARAEADEQAEAAQAAEQQADLGRLLASARGADAADPTVGLLLALEADRLFRADPNAFPTVTPVDTASAIHVALTARPARVGALPTGPVGSDITVLADGRRLVLHTADTVQLWDVDERTLVGSWDLDSAGASSAFEISSSASSDGTVIAASGPAGTIVISHDTDRPWPTIEHDPASVVAVSPDGSAIAIGYVDGTVEVRDVENLDSTRSITFPDTISTLSWRPDSQQLAIGTYASVVATWTPATGELVQLSEPVESPSYTNAAHGLLFTGDGGTVVVALQGVADAAGTNRATGARIIRSLDASTGEDVAEPTPDLLRIRRMDWSDADESAVIAASNAGPIGRVDLATGEVTRIGEKPTTSPAFGVLPELGVLASPNGETVELRDLDSSGPLARRIRLAEAQSAAVGNFLLGAFDADGSAFVTSALPLGSVPPHVTDLVASDGQPQVFDASGDSPPTLLVDGSGAVTMQQSAAGYTVRNGLDGDPIGPTIPYPVDPRTIRGVGTSPRGDRLALSIGTDVVLYDVTTGREIAVLEPLKRSAADVGFSVAQFSPDGAYLHTWNGFGSARYHAADGRLIWSTREFGFAYPGAGTEWMVTTDASGLLELRDPETLAPISDPLVGHIGEVIYGDVTLDGSHMATGSRDGTARVWSLEHGKQLGREHPTRQSSKRYWSPDGRQLALPEEAGFLLWNYDTTTWLDIACEVAGRNLTRAEWEAFGPRTAEYRATCPDYPIES